MRGEVRRQKEDRSRGGHMCWCPITDENEGKASWSGAPNAVQSQMTD